MRKHRRGGGQDPHPPGQHTGTTATLRELSSPQMPQCGTGGSMESSARHSGQHLLPQPGTGFTAATLPTLSPGSPAWKTEGTDQRHTTGQTRQTRRQGWMKR